MLVKYMRLVEKEKFAESLTLDVTEILKRNVKLEKDLSFLRDLLHKHSENEQIILGSLEKAIGTYNELENMVRLLQTNLIGFYKREEKQASTEQKTGLEGVMEKLQAISNNKGGLINDNNDEKE